jgi:hypothetical protein
MKRIVLIPIVMFTLFACYTPVNGDDSNKQNNSELIEKLFPIVKSVLEGKDFSEFKDNISPEAYVINGKTYESIFEILGNPSKKETFIEGEEIKFEYAHLLLSDNQDEAYLILETKSSDNTKTSWHSILFKLCNNRQWQILSWHKS